jgi:tRNA (guanine37-N1)-methyltransferase
VRNRIGGLLDDIGVRVEDYNLELDWNWMTAEQVMRAILPNDVEVPTSFETVGHIAHLNLRESQLPFKNFIGDVVLEKNKHIRTVVNKIGEISNEFRVFNMEVIAGDDDMETMVKESNCKFYLDYSKVYWNSKLHTEHKRIVDLLKAGDVVCDLFCGIGPFVVPAARAGFTCFANDLNPVSYSYLTRNLNANRVSNRVTSFNMDAKEAFYLLRKKELDSEIPRINHFIMNLPATAVEFLPMFRDAYSEIEAFENALPSVHCYCFERSEEAAVQLVENHLGCKLESHFVHLVRNVAPNKWMYCISFTIPRSILSKKRKSNLSEVEEISTEKSRS